MTIEDIIDLEYKINEFIFENKPEQALSLVEKMLKSKFDLLNDEQERLFERLISSRISLRLKLGKKDEIIQNCQGPSKPATQGHQNLPPVLTVFAILAISIQRVKFYLSVFVFRLKFLPV